MASNIHSSFVNNNEAEALKEMIFNRVRERADAFNATIDATYTTDVKTDIMEAARKSFVAEKNPFSEVKNSIEQTQTKTSNITKTADNDTVKEVPAQEPLKLKSIDNDYARTQIIENMNTAHNELSNRKGFIGALNFLNAQATNSLFRNKNNDFNMLA